MREREGERERGRERSFNKTETGRKQEVGNRKKAGNRKQEVSSPTRPPPGWYLMFSVEPILDLTFFRSGMGGAGVRGAAGRPLMDPGDLGGVRTTATFLTSRLGV